MVASRSARERKAAVQAGPLAKVKINCTECTVRGHINWSTLRPGEDNGFMAAMDRWIFHLREKHPAAEAPCLEFLEAAQQRLQERRDAKDA